VQFIVAAPVLFEQHHLLFVVLTGEYITSVPKVIWEEGRVAANVSNVAGYGQHA